MNLIQTQNYSVRKIIFNIDYIMYNLLIQKNKVYFVKSLIIEFSLGIL